MSASPAMLVGEAGRRGKIERGYSADFVIWDPVASFRVEREGLMHRHKGTPYLAEELNGVVEQTWLRGEKIFDKKDGARLNRGRVVI
jgi:allantoinase